MVRTNIERAYRKCCREIEGSVTHLERHGKTDKHIKNVNSENKSGNLTNLLQPTTFSVHITNVAAVELKLCSFIAERNLPVRLMDHLPRLIQYACPDSKITKDIKCFFSVERFFTLHDIPFEILIGLTGDNASVIMGQKGGVQARLKNEVPSLFIQGCACHSMYICASKACSELPSYLEELARSIRSFLANSPKRLQEYEEFQAFTQINPYQLLHISCTK
ncbi:uncharacterized protein LOC128247866 [Octopus bimaculoides]|uniref:uncharacterized protein LOC128247866 n=1 Tax=Octopus bimaculoides TaxID=37653 RepID=UPI0022DF1E2D|nr:uncharacterized protein LOC128247866 [Octopus bimaculoides]